MNFFFNKYAKSISLRSSIYFLYDLTQPLYSLSTENDDYSRNQTKVIVQNNFGKEIKVKVDCSRSFSKCQSQKHSGEIKDPNGDFFFHKELQRASGKVSMQFEQQKEHTKRRVVKTNDSFINLNDEEKTSFYPSGKPNEFAFLTVELQNDDGSTSLICDNHSILKRSIIKIGQNINCKQTYWEKDSDEWRSGRIDVINNSSKKIWVKVDADVIHEKQNSKLSLLISILQYKFNHWREEQKEQYYTVEEKPGFTMVLNDSKRNGLSETYTTFHFNIAQNESPWSKTYFYLSINYEKKPGVVESFCSEHSLSFMRGVYLLVSEPKETRIVPAIPRIYVTDSASGNGITFHCEYEHPVFVVPNEEIVPGERIDI